MRVFFLVIILISLNSCIDKEEKDKINLSELVQFDEKTGVLKIKKDKKHLVKIIELRSGINSKQNLLLDTTNIVGLIENVISTADNPNHLNTWIGFDNQSNFDHRESYYYETSLINENGKAYVNCFLPNFMYDKSKCYVILNSFDDQFRSNKSSDTLWFDENFFVRVPIQNYKFGLNNVKFIIVEEGFEKNKPKIKKTYVNKDFVVAKRSK